MRKSSQTNSGSALIWVVVLLALAGAGYFFLLRNKPERTAGIKEAATERFEQAKEGAIDAADSVKGYAFTQKTELVAKLQPKLDSMNRELAEANEKLKNASVQAKADAEPKLKALREQTAALGKHLENLKGATAETWDDVKGGFQSAYDKAKEGLKDAKTWVTDKVK